MLQGLPSPAAALSEVGTLIRCQAPLSVQCPGLCDFLSVEVTAAMTHEYPQRDWCCKGEGLFLNYNFLVHPLAILSRAAGSRLAVPGAGGHLTYSGVTPSLDFCLSGWTWS